MTEFKTPSSLVARDLDAIYLRATIDGHKVNRCLTDLLWEDVEAWLKENAAAQSPQDREAFLLRVIRHLHGRLRSMGDQLDIVCGTPCDAPDEFPTQLD